jgi:hypothetical protein
MADVVRSYAQEKYHEYIESLLRKCESLDQNDGLRDTDYTSVIDKKDSISDALKEALVNDQKYQDAEA